MLARFGKLVGSVHPTPEARAWASVRAAEQLVSTLRAVLGQHDRANRPREVAPPCTSSGPTVEPTLEPLNGEVKVKMQMDVMPEVLPAPVLEPEPFTHSSTPIETACSHEEREPTAWRLAGHISQSVCRHLRAIDAMGTLDALVHDPDALRAARVASRRLRAFVELFAPDLPTPLVKRLRKQLKRLTKALGELRQWDALQAKLLDRHRESAHANQRHAIEHLLGVVEAERKRARRRARKAIASVDAARIRKDTLAALDHLSGPLLRQADLSHYVEHRLRARVSHAVDRTPWGCQSDDHDSMHTTRVQMKNLRYAIEYLAPALPEKGEPLRKPAKRIQRSVGHARDLHLLLGLTQRELRMTELREQTQTQIALGCVEDGLRRELNRASQRMTSAIDRVSAQSLSGLAVASASQL